MNEINLSGIDLEGEIRITWKSVVDKSDHTLQPIRAPDIQRSKLTRKQNLCFLSSSLKFRRSTELKQFGVIKRRTEGML